MVKYSLAPEGTPKGIGLFLTIYPPMSPHMVIIQTFIIIMNNFCVVLQGSVIIDKLIHSIPLSGRARLHSQLPKGYISKYTPQEVYFTFFLHPGLVYWDLTLAIFPVQARYNVQWTP